MDLDPRHWIQGCVSRKTVVFTLDVQDSGPWLDLEVVQSAVEGVEHVLPKSVRRWWPPIFNLSHVALEDK